MSDRTGFNRQELIAGIGSPSLSEHHRLSAAAIPGYVQRFRLNQQQNEWIVRLGDLNAKTNRNVFDEQIVDAYYQLYLSAPVCSRENYQREQQIVSGRQYEPLVRIVELYQVRSPDVFQLIQWICYKKILDCGPEFLENPKAIESLMPFVPENKRSATLLLSPNRDTLIQREFYWGWKPSLKQLLPLVSYISSFEREQYREWLDMNQTTAIWIESYFASVKCYLGKYLRIASVVDYIILDYLRDI